MNYLVARIIRFKINKLEIKLRKYIIKNKSSNIGITSRINGSLIKASRIKASRI